MWETVEILKKETMQLNPNCITAVQLLKIPFVKPETVTYGINPLLNCHFQCNTPNIQNEIFMQFQYNI